jgi:hypothetical protein
MALTQKDKQFFKEALRYLLYKMGDGETPIKKIMRKRKRKKPMDRSIFFVPKWTDLGAPKTPTN